MATTVCVFLLRREIEFGGEDILLNCIFLRCSLIDKTAEPDRSGTFYLYGFPAAWKTSDILEGMHVRLYEVNVFCFVVDTDDNVWCVERTAFATFGNVQVRWVDDVSCFVIVHDDQAGKVLDYFGEYVICCCGGLVKDLELCVWLYETLSV